MKAMKQQHFILASLAPLQHATLCERCWGARLRRPTPGPRRAGSSLQLLCLCLIRSSPFALLQGHATGLRRWLRRSASISACTRQERWQPAATCGNLLPAFMESVVQRITLGMLGILGMQRPRPRLPAADHLAGGCRGCGSASGQEPCRPDNPGQPQALDIALWPCHWHLPFRVWKKHQASGPHRKLLTS